MYQRRGLSDVFGLTSRTRRVTFRIDNEPLIGADIPGFTPEEMQNPNWVKPHRIPRGVYAGEYLPEAIRDAIQRQNNETKIPTGFKKEYYVPRRRLVKFLEELPDGSKRVTASTRPTSKIKYTTDLPYGLDDPFKIPGDPNEDVWVRVKPHSELPVRTKVTIPEEIIHSNESTGGEDIVDIFNDPDSGLRYIEPVSDRHIEPLSWRKHPVRAENLGPGKRIYPIPIWREKIAYNGLKWVVIGLTIWNYIRYYIDILWEMIETDVWDIELLESVDKWLMAYADAMEKWQLDFQDPASPIMEGIINLHHDLMFFLLIIAVFVLWILLRTVYLFDRSKGHEPSKVVHGTVLEIVWTIVPSFILLAVAIPSFALLYAIDEASDPAITIKVIGHQWYWVYEYSDYTVDSKSLTFESFMVPETDLKLGQLRLLEVDNRIVVPTNTHIRFLITSTDVLHSWAVPALGVKVDAMPGRLNQATVFIKRDGVYYGQCSEICGVNHAFMPIVVESVPLDEYVSWVANQIEA